MPGSGNVFFPFLSYIPGRRGKISYGLCLELKSRDGIEYVCGVEVSDYRALPKSFFYQQLPSYTYAVFAHDSDVTVIRQAIDAIFKKWLPASGYERAKGADFFFERYGKADDPQNGTGDIEIWIPVQEPAR